MEYVFDEYLCENIYRKVHELYMINIKKELYFPMYTNKDGEPCYWIPPKSVLFFYMFGTTLKVKNKSENYCEFCMSNKKIPILTLPLKDYYKYKNCKIRRNLIYLIRDIRIGCRYNYIMSKYNIPRKLLAIIKKNYNRAFFEPSYLYN